MLLYSLYIFISGVMTFMLGMLVVAFFMLSERKVLGYLQTRKGPNKVGLLGLLQSFADFMKLITKFKVTFFQNRSWFSWVGMFFMLLACLGYCAFITSISCGCSSEWAFLWALVVSSMTGYSMMCIGWGSYNKYALISSIRCCFSAVSFEALFMCCVIQSCKFFECYSGIDLLSTVHLYSLLSPVLFMLWMFALLCECGRPPFDYPEAESEMVSGINVEYCKVPFICLFACEYYMMFSMSWITAVLFFGGILVLPVSLLVLFFFMWSRGSFPRARYDFFVYLMWEWCLVVVVFTFLLMI